MNTDNKTRRRFARLVMYVNLDKPLVAQIYIDGKPQRVEYEFLPTVCFYGGKCEHFKENCPNRVLRKQPEENRNTSEKATVIEVLVGDENEGSNDNFEPWMLVERKS